jgi:hypothetical protein
MRLERGVIAVVDTRCYIQFGLQDLSGQRVARQAAQNVETDHIARPLPNTVQRGFAIQ